MMTVSTGAVLASSGWGNHKVNVPELAQWRVDLLLFRCIVILVVYLIQPANRIWYVHKITTVDPNIPVVDVTVVSRVVCCFTAQQYGSERSGLTGMLHRQSNEHTHFFV